MEKEITFTYCGESTLRSTLNATGFEESTELWSL